MNVLVYTKYMSETEKRLQEVIQVHVPGANIEICSTIDSLSRRLKMPENDQMIAVLLLASRKDLFEMLSICDLLREIRIIIILPDRDEDTIANGHKLHPRFLSYIDNDFMDVAAVLGKMLVTFGQFFDIRNHPITINHGEDKG